LFSFFRKKSRADDATKAKLVDAITSLLSLQLVIVPNPSIEDTHGKINRKAIGYIYGYVDAFLRTRGYDMADTDIGVPVTFHVLRKLFPNHNATNYVEFLMQNLNDEMVALGCVAGGQQFLDYSKPNSTGAPMGLARFILEATG
jgi:hypothetical protein